MADNNTQNQDQSPNSFEPPKPKGSGSKKTYTIIVGLLAAMALRPLDEQIRKSSAGHGGNYSAGSGTRVPIEVVNAWASKNRLILGGAVDRRQRQRDQCGSAVVERLVFKRMPSKSKINSLGGWSNEAF